MITATKTKQLRFTIPNKVGLLAEVTAAIAGLEVNITSVAAYEQGDNAIFMVMTDNTAKVKKTLVTMGASVEIEDVLTVEMPNKAGELQKVARRIADAGINIKEIYGTTGIGKASVCVLKTAADAKVVKVLSR